MADPHRVAVTLAGRSAGVLLATARGRVTPPAVPALRDTLIKLLADGVPVLLDVADLRLEWAPAPEVFVSAITAAGGCPRARLVLVGADEHTTERLRGCRVLDAVPSAPTAAEAAALVDVRPARLTYGVDLPPVPGAVPRAREALREVCHRWGVAERDEAATVVAELVGNAVAHAATPLRLRLVLDRSGLRVSVRDRRPGALPDTADRHAPHGHGLRTVARLSRIWGVLLYDDGKAVWAQLPPTPRVRPSPPPATATRVRAPQPRPTPAGVAAVSVPRRRRFATADPELAHAFLRTVYGEHTLRLAAADEPPAFHLEYDGIVTDRFAVERLTHVGTVEALFATGDALVVVHALDGDLRVRSRTEEVRAQPGDVVLCATGGDILVGSTRLDVEVVRLPAPTVARVVAELTALGLDAATVPAHLSRPVSAAHGAHWRATVAHLRRDVLDNEEVMAGALSRAMVLRSLVAALMETFPNQARDTPPATPRGPVASRAVRRAVAFMEEHAGNDIGLADIAAAAGVGARGLQLAFRRHTDTTPLEHLRRVRLERAHRDLLAARPTGATVGAIADRWGFPHHGNFSTLYLRTYGCSPSMTLRS
jgi:AraC-like DNA-binding protein/anti-sigma regulatory factor (Ser/Thr protein kinase)